MSELPAVHEHEVVDPVEIEVSILIHVTRTDVQVGTLARAYSLAAEELDRRVEILFILDGIAGRVLQELEAMQADRDDIKVLALQGAGIGESNAYRAGLEHARGRYLLTVVDYLQVDPYELRGHLAALDDGKDLICSWRWPRIDPALNRLQSRAFNWFLRIFSRVDLNDLNCGFRAMRREVLEEIPIYGDLYRFLPIIATRRGFKVEERKVRHLEEQGKTGFFGIGVYFRRLLDILAVTFLTRFTRKPLRFFGIIGLVLIALGLLLGLPPFFARVFVEGASMQNRPIFLMGVVLVTFGIQLIALGLVGEIIIFTHGRNLKDYKINTVFRSGSATRLEAGADTDDALSAGLLIRKPAPGEDVLLDRYVESHPDGTFFHLSGWRRMVEEVLGKPPILLLAERQGEIVGLLPYFSLRSMFLGRVAISIPFAVYGGPIADDDEALSELVARASHHSDSLGKRYLELRNVRPAPGDLSESDLYVTFRRELPEDPEQCLGMLPRKARAEARRGRDRGKFQFEERIDLPLMQRLFSINKQELGSPSIPLSMLRALQSHLGDKMVMHVVSTPEGEPVAAVLSFIYKRELLAYYSGGLTEYEKLGVNNYMYWKLMEWAAERGLTTFDFGRSRAGSGAAAFKKNMGFEATALHYQYHLGDNGKLPEFHPGNPKLSGYQKLWRKVPAPIARMLSAKFFRQLP